MIITRSCSAFERIELNSLSDCLQAGTSEVQTHPAVKVLNGPGPPPAPAPAAAERGQLVRWNSATRYYCCCSS